MKFTEETLNKFDKVFTYNGTLETGLWAYEYKAKHFFVQVGGGCVAFINNIEIPKSLNDIDKLIDMVKASESTMKIGTL